MNAREMYEKEAFRLSASWNKQQLAEAFMVATDATAWSDAEVRDSFSEWIEGVELDTLTYFVDSQHKYWGGRSWKTSFAWQSL